MNKQTLERFKKLLSEKREQMVRDVEAVRSRSSEDTEEEDKDYIDYAVSSYTKEFLFSLSDLERKQLDAVDRALEAIEEGTYGTCNECGEEEDCGEGQEHGRTHASSIEYLALELLIWAGVRDEAVAVWHADRGEVRRIEAGFGGDHAVAL